MLVEVADDGPVGAMGEPGSHWFPLKPIGIEFGQSSVEVDDGDLKSEKVDCPGWCAVVFEFGPPYGIERPTGVGGKENRDPREEADQIEVVEIFGLIEEEEVGEA